MGFFSHFSKFLYLCWKNRCENIQDWMGIEMVDSGVCILRTCFLSDIFGDVEIQQPNLKCSKTLVAFSWQSISVLFGGIHQVSALYSIKFEPIFFFSFLSHHEQCSEVESTRNKMPSTPCRNVRKYKRVQGNDIKWFHSLRTCFSVLMNLIVIEHSCREWWCACS